MSLMFGSWDVKPVFSCQEEDEEEDFAEEEEEGE